MLQRMVDDEEAEFHEKSWQTRLQIKFLELQTRHGCC